MKRLVLLAILASCTDQPATDLRQPQPITVAEQRFVNDALPVLAQLCSSCHSGSDPAIAFLEGETWPQIRASLLGSSVIDLSYVPDSRLLTKGVHTGPYLTAPQLSAILNWLEAERD